VPPYAPFGNHIHRLSDAPPHRLKEIEHFFSIDKDLEKKKTGVEGWEDREAAHRIILDSERRSLSSLRRL
jgi:inorganic pyrophosphatase